MTESFIYPVSTLIAGLDAVECGPFVGAVVIAAVIPDPTRPVLWLADSKKLSEKRREALYEEITLCAITCWSVFRAKAFEINSINIYQPTMLAMQRAGADLPVVPDFMLVDGNRCPLLPMLAKAVVKDDRRVAEISAASIIPKIIRAREMAALHLQFPKYGFAQHKGRVPDRLPSEKAGASGRGLASSIKLCAVA